MTFPLVVILGDPIHVPPVIILRDPVHVPPVIILRDPVYVPPVVIGGDIVHIPLDLIYMSLQGIVSKSCNNDSRWRRDILTGNASTREASTSAQNGTEIKRIFEPMGMT
jgi:hypothetical protein